MRDRLYSGVLAVIQVFVVGMILVLSTGDSEVHASGAKPRPCDPHRTDAMYPPQSSPPRWRPGTYPGCLGGTPDAPGKGACQNVWCGDGALRISPDPAEVHEDETLQVQLSIAGRFETGGNAMTPNGGAEIDWGDGTRDNFSLSQALTQPHMHKYAKANHYYLSARVVQDYKYDGNGSCSYRCDVRRASVVIVYPALKPPYLHTVQKGESLAAITHKYRTNSWLDTYEANQPSIQWANLIYPGQVLLVASNVSRPQETFSDKVARAWARLRGAEHFDDEHALKATAHDAIETFGEWTIDKQIEIQTEGGRHEIESQIKDKLNHGAKGVVVRVAIYTRGEAKQVQVELWGEGETPLIGVGDGLGPALSKGNPGYNFAPEESFFSFYTMQNGELTHQDLPPGMLTSGDAEKIRADADKAKEALRIGKIINEQMKAAKEKSTLESDLQAKAKDAAETLAVRQSLDEGPRSNQRQQARNGGPPERSRDGHPDTDRGSLPKSDSDKSSSSGSQSSQSGGERTGSGGLPDPGNGVPIGGEHPGAPAHNGNDGGIPIGNPPKPSDHPLPEGNPWKDGKPENGPKDEKDQSDLRMESNARLMMVAWAAQSQKASSSMRTASVTTADAVKSKIEPSTTPIQDVRFWGFARNRFWIDVNKDGISDFCRVARAKAKGYVLQCTLAAGREIADRYRGATFETPITGINPAVRTGTWVDVNGDGFPDYCREIPTRGTKGFLSCIPSHGGNFGAEIRNASRIELGLASMRTWIDFDGDGKADFCTFLPSGPGRGRLSCRLSTDQGFSGEAIVSGVIRWRGPQYSRWITTSSGTVEFCTVAGNSYVDCTISSKGVFGDTYRDLLDHRPASGTR